MANLTIKMHKNVIFGNAINFWENHKTINLDIFLNNFDRYFVHITKVKTK